MEGLVGAALYSTLRPFIMLMVRLRRRGNGGAVKDLGVVAWSRVPKAEAGGDRGGDESELLVVW